MLAAAGEAGEEGGSLAEAALDLFGDPALAARCQAALRGTDPAALASLCAAGGSAAAAQHTIAALTDAVRQLGGCLEAMLGQQQRLLSAAATWEARAAGHRRGVRARAAAAAAELLHARNALAEALAREQRLRADCEARGAELAVLRASWPQQRPQRGRRAPRPEPAKLPAAARQEE
ncbi:hypothetical protein WJX81_005899 [Elliptochloris bilobata]|uniref:Biogenesis of lysosome-related organelles complex 1 subunit 5 n=1 Tax=Elliptochloris bilobata TaxID=381761 RepID=A0AAW1QHJ7_9CHLO